MAEFGASSFCRDCSTAVISTGGSEGTVMEESVFRGARDLSAPWLRHFGRDDGWVVATSFGMTVGCICFGRDDGRVVVTPVEMTVGGVATSVEITGLDRVQLGLKRAIFGFLGFAITQFGRHL